LLPNSLLLIFKLCLTLKTAEKINKANKAKLIINNMFELNLFKIKYPLPKNTCNDKAPTIIDKINKVDK